MELVPRKIEAWSDSEWKSAWSFTPHVAREDRSKTPTTHRDSLMNAAKFVEEYLAAEDFYFFSNGGQPLLKRQREGWFDEILFHAPPSGVPGHYAPVSIEIMVSFEALRQVRAKYSRSYTQVPACVAHVNIGQLLKPSRHTLWNLESDSIEEIADLVYKEGLAWIEDLCDPQRLEERACERSLPFVDYVTALELVIAIGGKRAGRRVIDTWREDPVIGPDMEKQVGLMRRQVGPVYRGDDNDANIASLCICYDLWSRQRLSFR